MDLAILGASHSNLSITAFFGGAASFRGTLLLGIIGGHLTAIGNFNIDLGLVARPLLDVLDPADNIHALYDLSEDDVLPVEVGGVLRSEEELAAIGSRPGVSHGEEAAAGVLDNEVLIGELLSIDGLPARAVAAGEVAALAHEV